MLMICPECGHSVSDKAVSCPNCGYPINSLSVPQKTENKPRKPRRKHKKLPNGFGSIKKLSGHRSRPYAAYPPTTEYVDGIPKTMPAIGYYEDWYTAFDALREYNHNPYDIEKSALTFKDVYEMFFQTKFINNKKKISKQSEYAYTTAFKNCPSLHSKSFLGLKKNELQQALDNCQLGYSSLQNIKKLFGQMFKYAIENDITDKNYAQFVTINSENDNESGEPFSQEELDILWANKENETVEKILIMIYSGYRIKAFETIKINLEERYFQGGVKTAAGKDRIVPIHSSIYQFATKFNTDNFKSMTFRVKEFYPTLERLKISITQSGKKHTPHDCRHTFSWLCDKYKVDDLSKHLLMGHSLGNDVEKSVYGHRTLEELRQEIAKIRV